MHFLCTGKCKKVFEILYRRVFTTKDEFSFCNDGLSLIQTVLTEKNEDSIIFMDYDLYRNFTELIYDIFRSKQLKIPLILVGDPKRNAVERMNYWVSINEFQYEIQTLHLMAPLFRRITDCLESPEVKKLIFEGDELESSPELALPVKAVRQNILECFRKSNKMPPSIYNLLVFLFKHRCREVSVDEIASYMNISGESEKSRKNAVYAYIAKLRRFIDCTPRCSLEILRTRTGYYKLLLR